MFVLQIVIAAFRADGKAGRYRKADARHLGEPRPLAAQDLFHLAVAFGFACAKEVDVFHFVSCPRDCDLLCSARSARVVRQRAPHGLKTPSSDTKFLSR